MADHDFGSVWAVLSTTPLPDADGLNVASVGILADGREVIAGLDSKGDRHMLVPLLPAEQFRDIGAGRALQLRTVLLPAGRYAGAICRDRRLDEVFGQFARELMDSIMQSGKPGRDMKVAYEHWRALFAEPATPALSEGERIGLLGELLTLREVLSVGAKCEVWRGPSGAAHDFRTGIEHIEVKSTLRREGVFVTIHGVEQLSAPLGENLHLIVHRLEESDGGVSLNSLVREVERVVDDVTLFETKLRDAGFRWEHFESYETRYRVVETVMFNVLDEEFPKIVERSFEGGRMPAGTTELSYVIDLSGPAPRPIPSTSANAVLHRLALK